ncbi:hypothetical protein HU675_0038430 [Bradyrhizobium septentrionale]|uniref:hypothetical protein n=1 Tax=Bradyrhizobium septentrionale TaxID=1404411 RepID=UPI001596F914|nr:hypothetical protein [Bradyrhizobium septentrionale]UGY23765.1 hypothetical protein HU675_0038430 [Bradyrhizobium septentrionale]
MKRRRNELVVIECFNVDEDAEYGDIVVDETTPHIARGGEEAEASRLALLDGIKRIYGYGNWTARIVYRFRSPQHLRRWLRRGSTWRGRHPVFFGREYFKVI